MFNSTLCVCYLSSAEVGSPREKRIKSHFSELLAISVAVRWPPEPHYGWHAQSGTVTALCYQSFQPPHLEHSEHMHEAPVAGFVAL